MHQLVAVDLQEQNRAVGAGFFSRALCSCLSPASDAMDSEAPGARSHFESGVPEYIRAGLQL
jgi:hypothetical protein